MIPNVLMHLTSGQQHTPIRGRKEAQDKLLALMLLAGGSIFAQARFSHDGNAQAQQRYRAPAYSSNSGRNQLRDDDNRYDNDYGRIGRSRSFDRDHVRGHAQNYWQDGRYGNRFNGR